MSSYHTVRKHLQTFIREKYRTVDIPFGQIEEDFLECPPQLRHADLGGWHSDREHRQDDGAFVHCQHANLCPNH